MIKSSVLLTYASPLFRKKSIFPSSSRAIHIPILINNSCFPVPGRVAQSVTCLTLTADPGFTEAVLIIRIHHEFEGGIEKYVPRITDWHHDDCRVTTNGDREGRIFLFNGFFFLLSTKYLIFIGEKT